VSGEGSLPRGIWYATAGFAVLTAVALVVGLRVGSRVIHDGSLDGPPAAEKPAAAAPAFTPAPAPAPADDRTAAQHWNDGLLAYQRGDYAKARDEWKACVDAAPENADCAAGLSRIDGLYPSGQGK
jgi:hypothetical protein